jgi:RNA polymerase sigma-70 factor, ECF subfamily
MQPTPRGARQNREAMPETADGPDAAVGQVADATAVKSVLAGNHAAFEGIVQRWQGRLVTLAWRFCRDRTMAEDLAQEAFLKAFKSLATFRAEAAFSTWLTAIALNTYRSALRRREPMVPLLDAAKVASSKPYGHAVLDERRRAELVRQAVLKLPPRYRDALVLYYFEEKDLIESARVLSVPAGTLKARLHRARELLKRRLAGRMR